MRIRTQNQMILLTPGLRLSTDIGMKKTLAQAVQQFRDDVSSNIDLAKYGARLCALY